jgi:hypothetical protein
MGMFDRFRDTKTSKFEQLDKAASSSPLKPMRAKRSSNGNVVCPVCGADQHISEGDLVRLIAADEHALPALGCRECNCYMWP